MRHAPDLEQLYDKHAQALFTYLLNFTRNEADTRDLLQEVFVKLARHPEILRNLRDERAFLLRLGHNAAVDLMRHRATRDRAALAQAEEFTHVFEQSNEPDTQAFREALGRALGELPVEQRAVVHLKLWEGLTFEAIAELLGVSLNTTASRYRYGVDKLRDRLRPLYDEIK